MPRDFRHALGLLAHTPAVTLVAVLSLAITIGLTGVVFTALKTVLLDPLPYKDPGDLIELRSEGLIANWVNAADMDDVRKRNRTLESLGTYHYALFNLKGDSGNLPQGLYGLYVSADLFPTLGVAPMLGRNILPEETEPGREREVILSYGLWVRRFASDRDIIGRTLVANGRGYTIVGVMPPGFGFPLRLATTVRPPSPYMEFWAPLTSDLIKADRHSTSYGAVARLKPGVNRLRAEQDLASIAKSLAHEYPLTNKNREVHAVSLTARTYGSARPALWILMSAAAMFLLIGCANVANLLLARSVARKREIALRLALGASPARIARQFIAESMVLAAAGGIGGCMLAAISWRLLPAIIPTSIPRLDHAHVDWTVIAVTLAVAVANGLIFGIVPALSASHDPANALRESGARGSVGPGRNRLRSVLVVAEIAITVVLVITGGLLMASFARLLRNDLGFEPDHLLASIIVPQGDAFNSRENWSRFYRRVLEGARALPGVESAGIVNALPFSGESSGASVRSDGAGESKPGDGNNAEFDRTSSTYLRTMGIRLLKGRWFVEQDEAASSDAAIIDENAARCFWPGQDPIGKRICMDCGEGRTPSWKRVIGVVNSTKHYALDAPAGMQVYVAASASEYSQFLVLRTRGRAMDLAEPLRRMVATLDPNVPVFLSAEMSTFIGDSVSDRRFTMALLAITGILALLLAAAGVYAVVSYVTSQRTQEIGVRMALGATRGNVAGMVVREGMTTAGAGVAIGLAAALMLNRVLRGVLAGLGNNDAATIAIAVILVTATAAAACFLPARRATRIDPIAILRND